MNNNNRQYLIITLMMLFKIYFYKRDYFYKWDCVSQSRKQNSIQHYHRKNSNKRMNLMGYRLNRLD